MTSVPIVSLRKFPLCQPNSFQNQNIMYASVYVYDNVSLFNWQSSKPESELCLINIQGGQSNTRQYKAQIVEIITVVLNFLKLNQART